jgi:MEMO1 family protein
MVFRRAEMRTRPPAVAGTFYPAASAKLEKTVADLLAAVPATGGREPAGIIVPHAGYVYSAVTAAHAFARVAGLSGRWQRAVIIGPAHYIRFSGVAAPAVSGFATPLGELPVDGAAIADLAAEGLIAIDDRPHRSEHAIEVELPFLQMALGRPPIVPLLCGATSARAVAAAIAAVWRADTLLVVSSDLSHYESYAAACRNDARTAAAIEAGRGAAIGAADACGHVAIRGALIAAAERGSP